MSIKDEYFIKPINYETAEDVVVKCHYAHRKASCVYAFGLYSKKPLKLRGVIIYGIPASDFVCKGVCGVEERENVYELTRLYVDDVLPKNLESYFISHTIKQLDREIIVSYSDTAYNHVGVVYQATNFIYTGLGHSQKDPVSNDNKHNRHNTNTIKDNGYVVRSPKHRYVYFNCDRRRKRILMQKLRWKIQPYPKATQPVPITSTVNIDDTKRKNRLF